MNNWIKWSQAKMKSIPGDQNPSEWVSQQLALNTLKGLSITIVHYFQNLKFWLVLKMKYETYTESVPKK